MGLLSSGLTAATQIAGGYQNAQANAATERQKALVQQIAMLRQQHEDQLKDDLMRSQTANYNRQANPVAPRDPVADHAANRDYDIKNPLPTTPKSPSLIPGTQEWKDAEKYKAGLKPAPQQPLVVVQDPNNPTGPGVYTRRDQAAGMSQPAKAGAADGSKALAAPMAAKVGQAGEMLKKASDLLPAMDAMNVSLDRSAGQDIATNGLGVGHARIPGTQGVGSLMVNRSPEFSTYQASLGPFVLAAAHALSGARINDEQTKQIRASIEIKPGDTPQVRAQKKKNVIDLMNSINGSLPGDAIGAQEDQMDLSVLKGHGYHPAKRGAPVGPTGNVDFTRPEGTTRLGGGAISPLRQKYDAAVAHLKATGRAAEIPNLPVPPEDE